MQIYIESNDVYNFDKQKMFRPKYIVRNTRSSQKYRMHDEKSMGRGGSLLAKKKSDKNLFIISFQQRGKSYKLTHFLLYDC